jgi:hypothetical protein
MSAEDESRFSKCRLKVFDVDDDDKDSDAFKRRIKKSPNLVNKTIWLELKKTSLDNNKKAVELWA